jgi:predicted nucleic acid-binding protein
MDGGPVSPVILLDTNILIDLSRHAFKPEELYSASILSRAELEFGLRQAKDPTQTAARTEHLNTLDAWIDWLPFDLECSRSYGLLAGSATAIRGARLRSKDALIAAQAHRFGAAVMTQDLRGFRPFEPLIRVVAPIPGPASRQG